MISAGTPILIDLVSSGSPTVSVTPGTTVQSVVFQPAQLKQNVGGNNWPLAKREVVKVAIVFDQAAAGGSVANADQLFVAIDSLNLFVPLLGTTHLKDVYTGPVAKHVAEFVSGGYRYYDFARAQIPAADGDSPLVLYVALPFANECFVEPEDFMPWAGWLLNQQLTVNIAPATTIASVSTGAVTKTPCTVSAFIEAYPYNEPRIPVLNQFTKYVQAASAGATTFLLQNVGQPNGLTNVLNGCRLAGLFELMSKLGLGGTSTADNYTGFNCPDLGQDQTVSVDGFFGALKAQIGHRGPIAGSGTAGQALADGAGWPMTMAATPNGNQNDTNAILIPWRFCAADGRQKLTNVVKWLLGNLALIRTFAATPSTGSYIAIANEIRQLNDTGKKQLFDAANIPMSIRQLSRPAFAVKGEGYRAGQAAVMSQTIRTRAGG